MATPKVDIYEMDLRIGEITVTVSNLTPAPDPVPVPQLDPACMWGYLPHDYELKALIGYSVWTDDVHDRDGKHRWAPLKIGDPETVTTYYKEARVVMNAEWQWFAFRQLILACYGHTDPTRVPPQELKELKNAWLNLMAGNKVITNNTGWDNGYQDVITGTNPGKEYFRYMPLCMGGNVVKITGEDRPKGPFGPSYVIETLDASKPVPDPDEINFISHPWLFSRATVARYVTDRELDSNPLKNRWSHVIPFPQLAKWDAHVPLLNISRNGVNYVQKSRCVPWNKREIPNPYHPEKQKAHG